MATTYYVRPDGNDANTGTGPTAANAWATWAKPIAKPIAAGDTIYFAPGTYRETVTLPAGSAGNVTQWLGDPYCEKFTDMHPGYVRLTGCNASEVAGTTIILTSGGDYFTVKNIVIDGVKGAANTITVSVVNRANVTLDSCIIIAPYFGISGSTSTTYPTIKNCLVVSGNYGIKGCLCYNCICFCASESFLDGKAYDCLGFGAGTTAIFSNNSEVWNCLAVGGAYGYRTNIVGTNKNNIALSCHYGFSTAQNQSPLTNCLAVCCRYGAYGTSGTNKLNLNSFKHLYCYALGRGASYETGTPVAADHCGYANIYKIVQLAHALRFDLFNEKNWSDDTVSWTGDSVDILGQIRRMGNGTIDVGPLEYTNSLPEYSDIKTTTPALKIYQKGEIIFPITATMSVSKTVNVWVKFALDGGVTKPKLAVSALDGCISADSDTATGDGSAYEQLSVTFTPSYTGTVQLKFQALETATNAYALFSDLTVA